MDVHLMIVHPERHVQAFRGCGRDLITVHYEACTHLHSTSVQEIHNSEPRLVAQSLTPR